MAGAAKKKISLPPDVRGARARRLGAEFREVQGFWSAKAKAKGILNERDLDRLLRK
jgi:hypothetical protein